MTLRLRLPHSLLLSLLLSLLSPLLLSQPITYSPLLRPLASLTPPSLAAEDYIDITSTLTPTQHHYVALPFGTKGFPFYNAYYQYVGITSAGNLQFHTDLIAGYDDTWPNGPMPDALSVDESTNPPGYIAPFFAALYFDGNATAGYAHNDSEFRVRFSDVDLYAAVRSGSTLPYPRLSFDVVLYADGTIVVNYYSVPFVSDNPPPTSDDSSQYFHTVLGIQAPGDYLKALWIAPANYVPINSTISRLYTGQQLIYQPIFANHSSSSSAAVSSVSAASSAGSSAGTSVGSSGAGSSAASSAARSSAGSSSQGTSVGTSIPVVPPTTVTTASGAQSSASSAVASSAAASSGSTAVGSSSAPAPTSSLVQSSSAASAVSSSAPSSSAAAVSSSARSSSAQSSSAQASSSAASSSAQSSSAQSSSAQSSSAQSSSAVSSSPASSSAGVSSSAVSSSALSSSAASSSAAVVSSSSASAASSAASSASSQSSAQGSSSSAVSAPSSAASSAPVSSSSGALRSSSSSSAASSSAGLSSSTAAVSSSTAAVSSSAASSSAASVSSSTAPVVSSSTAAALSSSLSSAASAATSSGIVSTATVSSSSGALSGGSSTGSAPGLSSSSDVSGGASSGSSSSGVLPPPFTGGSSSSPAPIFSSSSSSSPTLGGCSIPPNSPQYPNVTFYIDNVLSTLTLGFGGQLAMDVEGLAGDESVWICGSITPLNTFGRRLLQLAPTAQVLMLVTQNAKSDPNNGDLAVNDFSRSLAATNGNNSANFVYTGPVSGALIPVGSTVIYCQNGTRVQVGQECLLVVTPGSDPGLSKGAIAGIVIGAIAFLVCLLCILCLALMRLCKRTDDDTPPPSSEASRIKDAPLAAPARVQVQVQGQHAVRVAGGAAALAGAAGAMTTAPDLSADDSEYHEYNTPEQSLQDPDDSSQLHIHV